MRDSRNYSRIIVILLITASCVAFGRIAGNDFINFDDISYITGNNYIQSGFNSESIKWVFTAIVDGNWHPLTMISHMLDWSLFGANASGHHLVSLLFHKSILHYKSCLLHMLGGVFEIFHSSATSVVRIHGG